MHNAAGWVGVHAKCAPGEVTKERRMAKSMSFHQSGRGVKVGCEEQGERRERCAENMNINRFSKRIRRDITGQDEKLQRDILGR